MSPRQAVGPWAGVCVTLSAQMLVISHMFVNRPSRTVPAEQRRHVWVLYVAVATQSPSATPPPSRHFQKSLPSSQAPPCTKSLPPADVNPWQYRAAGGVPVAGEERFVQFIVAGS